MGHKHLRIRRLIAAALVLATAPLLSAGCELGEIPIGNDTDPTKPLDPACPESSRGLGKGVRCDDVPHGTACFFPANEYGERDACFCGCKLEGYWTCEGTNARFSDDCPRLMPVEGAACIGVPARPCFYYPDMECHCFNEEGWSCSRVLSQPSCSDPPVWQGPTSPIYKGKHIKDLTDDEATAWCAWYAQVMDSKQEKALPDAEGWVKGWEIPDSYVATVCTPPSVDPNRDACALDIPVDYCVGSLKAQPCEATIGELEDCVKTLDNQCFLVGHGCTPFLERPWCRGVIVGKVEAKELLSGGGRPFQVLGCSVHVEDPLIDIDP